MNIPIHERRQAMKYKLSSLRVIAGLLVILPVVGLFALTQFAHPDIEVWLSEKTNGDFRSDAFKDVARIMPFFRLSFSCTAVLACALIILRRENLALLLLVGPAVGVAAYLSTFGLTDPAWFSFLACSSVGMLVGTSVIAAAAHKRCQEPFSDFFLLYVTREGIPRQFRVHDWTIKCFQKPSLPIKVQSGTSHATIHLQDFRVLSPPW